MFCVILIVAKAIKYFDGEITPLGLLFSPLINNNF